MTGVPDPSRGARVPRRGVRRRWRDTALGAVSGAAIGFLGGLGAGAGAGAVICTEFSVATSPS